MGLAVWAVLVMFLCVVVRWGLAWQSGFGLLGPGQLRNGPAVEVGYGTARRVEVCYGSQGWECCVPVGYLRVSRGLAVEVSCGESRCCLVRCGRVWQLR